MQTKFFLALCFLGISPAFSAEEQVTLKVDKMMCSACAGRVRQSISSNQGVSDVHVSLNESQARFRCDTEKGCDKEAIKRRLGKIGYPAKE